MNQTFASLTDHLLELRKRLLWVLAVMTVSMIAGFFFARRLIVMLLHAKPAAGMAFSLNAFSPWDSVRIFVQVSFLAGLCFALPFALFQLWLFVKPGLTELEQKATLRYIPGASFLFLTGIAFGYFVIFPMAFRFTIAVTQSLGLTETYGVAQYFSFLFNIVLPMSLLFQLPVVVMFLTQIRLINPMRLKKLRKAAYLLLIIIATFVTPPDLISDVLVAAPLILLYEASVLLSARLYRRQLEQSQEKEPGFGADRTAWGAE